jgi:hypothetical protein
MKVFKNFLISFLAALVVAATAPVAVCAENDNHEEPTSSSKEEHGHTKVLSATEHGYKIDIFECDLYLQEIKNRPPMSQGSGIRICFRPNYKAIEDGVFIRRVDAFTWEMPNPQQAQGGDGNGLLAQQAAVINGQGDGVLSALHCDEQQGFKELCFLETLLRSDFYQTMGSIRGYGQATLTFGNETIQIDRWHLSMSNGISSVKSA